MDETTQEAPVQEPPAEKSGPKKKPLRDDREFVDVKFRQVTKGDTALVRTQIREVVNANLEKLSAMIRMLLRTRRRNKFAAVKLSLDVLERAVALTFANTPGLRRSILCHITVAATTAAAKSANILPIERVRQIAGCGRSTMMSKPAAKAIQLIALQLISDIKDTVAAGQKACGDKHVRSIMPYLQLDTEARVYSCNVRSLNEPCVVTRMQWHAMMY